MNLADFHLRDARQTALQVPRTSNRSQATFAGKAPLSRLNIAPFACYRTAYLYVATGLFSITNKSAINDVVARRLLDPLSRPAHLQAPQPSRADRGSSSCPILTVAFQLQPDIAAACKSNLQSVVCRTS